MEVTIQNLIGSGMDPKTENNPYLGFIYTSFQASAAGSRGLGAAGLHAAGLAARGWPRRSGEPGREPSTCGMRA